MVEGETEMAFKVKLQDFLKLCLGQNMPKLKFIPQQGRIPKGDKLRRVVENLLTGRDAEDFSYEPRILINLPRSTYLMAYQQPTAYFLTIDDRVKLQALHHLNKQEYQTPHHQF